MNEDDRAKAFGRCGNCGSAAGDLFFECVQPAPDNGPFRGGRWGVFYAVCNPCQTYWMVQLGREHGVYEERPAEFREYREIVGWNEDDSRSANSSSPN